MNRDASRPRLVLVDDDPADRNLVKRALRAIGARVELSTATNLEEARGLVESPHRTPTLVLLDLNLSTEDGRDLLRSLGAAERLSSLLVVIFTSSNRADDVDECYALGAKSYVRKPSSYPELQTALRTLIQYWFETVAVPTAGGRFKP